MTPDPGPLVMQDARVRLLRRFGPAAEPWLLGIEDELRARAAEWDLTLIEAARPGGTAVVVRVGLAAGGEAYLKLTPDHAIARAEARALDHWATTGRVPHVLARDEAGGALLLEAVEGDLALFVADLPLADVAALVNDLHDEPPGGPEPFEPLAARVAFFSELWEERFAGDPALDAIRRSGEAAVLLAADGLALPRLLHGDLHLGNVFASDRDRRLIAFDPRPCIGDQAFDLVDWVFGRIDDPAVWHRRAEQLAALTGADAARTWQWCRIYAATMAAQWRRAGGGPERARALDVIAL